MSGVNSAGVLSRRTALKTLAAMAGAAAVPAPFVKSALAADKLVVRDAGGLYQTAVIEAYHKPFTQETGIEVVPVSATTDPLAQVKAMVEAKSYIWDVVLNRIGGAELLGNQGYLEKIDWSAPDMKDLIPRAHSDFLMGTDVFASVYGYRTDTVKGEPNSWADFWDTHKFPGRRSLSKNAIDTLEEALLADGVASDKLYPLDIPRALKKLDQIKADVAVWWTGGAQASQMLKTGEADFVASWNARVQSSIDDGAPVKLVWNQGLYGVEGWTIPKGDPKRDIGQKFIQFCARPDRQAAFAQVISYGPTNPKAFEHIAKERAPLLPTAPEHFDKMIYQDHDYWAKHQEDALEQFNNWLLL
jgi:putative spermidine/putrescine transport system substrate-binding protein